MAEVHPLCCDCCACLNGSGGLVLPSGGRLQSATPPQEGQVSAEASARVRAHECRQVNEMRRRKRVRLAAGARQ